jgi:hypothetical protein
MKMDSGVKEIVQKAHKKNEEIRASKRLDALSTRRKIADEDFKQEVSDKEAKTLVNLCKSGRISVDQMRDLSQALSDKPDLAAHFLDSDGCLHALTGLLSGKDSSKQLLALQCLVNLSAHAYKAPKVARAAGAYLVTLVSGTNQPLAEFSCCCIANLAMAEKLSVTVLLSQEVVPTLLRLVQESQETLQEAALQALYYLVKDDVTSVPQEQIRLLVSTSLKLMKDPRPPIHLLWLLFSLSSCQSLHNVLSSRSFLNRCLDLCTYEIFQKCDSRPLVKLLTPTVRILGNLSAGPDSVTVCLNLVRHPDFPAILTALLSTNYLHLCRESLWLFANIVNNESVTVQEEFVNLDLMDKLETHAVHAVGRLDPYALG